MAPDLRNTKSAKSLTGRGLSSLFKTEHTQVLLPLPELVNSSFRKYKKKMMQRTVHFGRVASGVLRFKFRWGTQTCVGSPPDLISHVESVRVALWSLDRWVI